MKKLIAAVVVVGALFTPAMASAAIRTGHVDDPQGDTKVLSGPNVDYKSIDVTYDDVAGKLKVVPTFYTDIRNEAAQDDPVYGSAYGYETLSGPYTQGHSDSIQLFWTVTAKQDYICAEEEPYECDYIRTGWDVTASLNVSGFSGNLSIPATLSDDGRSLTIDYTDTRLAGPNLHSVTQPPMEIELVTTRPGGSMATVNPSTSTLPLSGPNRPPRSEGRHRSQGPEG